MSSYYNVLVKNVRGHLLKLYRIRIAYTTVKCYRMLQPPPIQIHSIMKLRELRVYCVLYGMRVLHVYDIYRTQTHQSIAFSFHFLLFSSLPRFEDIRRVLQRTDRDRQRWNVVNGNEMRTSLMLMKCNINANVWVPLYVCVCLNVQSEFQ